MKLTFLGHRNEFRRAADRLPVQRVPLDGSARQAHARGGGGRDGSRTRLLIDTPPELRLQLIANGIDRVDAVLFTHDHADHTHGLDDIRAISVRRDGPLPMYGSAETLAGLARKFPYVFDDIDPPDAGHVQAGGPRHRARPGRDRADRRRGGPADPASARPCDGVRLPHRTAGLCDRRQVDPGMRRWPRSRGAKVLVLNALFRTEHPTHLSVHEAIRTAQQLGAERTYLTHLTHDNYHADLEAELPRGISPAFDGLTVRVG